MKRTVLITLFILIIRAMVFAGGNSEKDAPDILIESTGNGFISPANKDGIQDNAEFYILYQPKSNYVINGYKLEIHNSAGKIVYSRSGKNPVKSTFFDTFLSSLKLKKKKAYEVPFVFSWDGKDNTGKAVEEGEYSLVVSAVDDKGREGISRAFAITVDNTPPRDDVHIPFEVFSPNGDGKQDVLVVEQNGSSENSWTARIITQDGDTLFYRHWNGSKPESFSWDGVTPFSKAFPDGTYKLEINAMDKAGNRYSYTYDSIRIDTLERNVNMALGGKYFSPNNDGKKDVLEFLPEIDIPEGMKEWQLQITDKADNQVRTFKGYNKVPEKIDFDGKNDGGRSLPEGVYYAVFQVKYSNGASPEKRTADFSIDLTEPVAAVKRDIAIFSPNGDGNQDRIFIQQNTSSENEWKGQILNEDYIAVRTYQWKGQAEPYFYWDGITNDGTMSSDGKYLYVLSCEDPAGNFAEAKTSDFTKDTRDLKVSLSTERQYFNPLADKANYIKIIPDIESPSDIVSFRLWISDSNGLELDILSGENNQKEYSWKGTSSDRTVLADGAYYANVEVGYKNGNVRKAKSSPVYIDTVFPSVEIDIPQKSFSPDGDGIKDRIAIRHSNVSIEENWSALIRDKSGKIVREFLFNEKPSIVYWDGMDENGNVADDGTYSYEMKLEDAAGNITLRKIKGIVVDTKKIPVSLKINSASFSPNRDNINDSMVFTPLLEDSKDIGSWKLAVRDAAKKTVYQLKGDGTPPGKISFKGTDQSNRILPEGVYTAELQVEYSSGKLSRGNSPPFGVDLTPPKAKINLGVNVFSPNGDGKKDDIIISQSGSAEGSWHGIIKDSLGRIIREYEWRGDLPSELKWNGRNGEGRLVDDGEYVYQLDASDDAGNQSRISSSAFFKNTRSTELVLSLDNKAFSPNNDGSRDVITVQASLNYTEGINSYTFKIKDDKNNELYTLSKENRVPLEFPWNGKDKNGRTLPDGKYKAELEVVYSHGNVAKAENNDIVIDTVSPTAEISTPYLLFSPDGDNRKDVISIKQNTSRDAYWEGNVYDDAGKLINKAFWQGAAADFIWDGTDQSGNLVTDGTYRYVLTGKDDAGNSYSVRLDKIEIDNRKPYVYTNFDLVSFSPNGDKIDDKVSITVYASMKENIAKWKLDIYEQNYKKIVKSIEGTEGQDLPEKISWDGKTSGGKVIDGLYKSRLTVQYDKGNLVESESDKSVLLDTNPPDVDVMLSAQPFSPDSDGVDDELEINVKVSNDPSGIRDWRIVINDPKGNMFREFRGTGAPSASVVWDGRSDTGELVQSAEDYPMYIYVTDMQNNKQTVQGFSSIDILVRKEGDRLKIQISSITFAPDTADFKHVDAAKAAKNMKTLARLAEILKKFDNYDILIEGHAASVYWNNPRRYEREEKEELLPLSKARADAVKKALIDLGLAAGRIRTAGLGGKNPLFPHSDEENRWKNRRVEFILIRQ